MARYALVIGISEYQTLSNLQKTQNDAEAIAKVLEEYGRFRVKRLPESWNPDKKCMEIGLAKVKSSDLRQQLKKLLLEQAPNSDVLIYFAGHGFTISDNFGKPKGYLAASDCQIELAGNQISEQKYGIDLNSLNDLIQESKSSSLVMLLDCCHSGYFLESQMIRQTLTAFSWQKDYCLITACRSFEESLALMTEEHSFFTQALLKGLARENANKKGRVSGDRLFDYISDELKNWQQEPIRMGWGSSITLIEYPPESTKLEEVIAFNRDNPYRGLYAFEAEQEKYFAGREQAIRTLLAHLEGARFLSVIGPSGCGKSSLVKAGLLPLFRRNQILGSSQWEIQSFTPGKYPLGRLVNILEQRHQTNLPFVLFIDQFEEVFTLCDDEEQRRNFLGLMAQQITNFDCMTQVIVAIRGDFLERCADYPEVADLINEARPTAYIVKPLNRMELEETIEKPAAIHGVKFEHGLVSQIAEDVEEQPGALPLLQYALKELWQVCIEAPKIPESLLTIEAYQEIGGVKGALEKRASRLYQESFVSDTEKAFVRQLFMELVQLGEGKEVTRRRANWERLEAIASSPQQLQKVVGQLADWRLIVTNSDTVEVAHEALLSEWSLLRGWIEENRESIRLNRELQAYCREWNQRFNKSDDDLLTGARLAAIEEWVKQKQPLLLPHEKEYLQKSLQKREQEKQADLENERLLRELAESRQQEAEARVLAEIEKALEAEARVKAEAEKVEEANARIKEAEIRAKVEKQRTRLAIAGGILAVFTLGFALVAQRFSEQVSREKEINVVKSIEQSKNFLEKESQLESLISSVKALKELEGITNNKSKYLREIQHLISQVREENRYQGHEKKVNSISFSKDGTIASGSEDGTIKLWKPNSSDSPKTIKTGIPVNSVRFSPDGETIVSGSKDGTIKLWKKDGSKLNFPTEKHSAQVWRVSFRTDGEIFASASYDRTIKLWKKDGTFIKTLPASSVVYGVSFSREDGTIASGNYDGTIQLWTKDGDFITSIQADKQTIYDVSFSPDGQTIVSAGHDKVVKLWKKKGSSWKDGLSLEKEFEGHEASVYSVSFNSDGTKIASAGGNDETLRIWNINEESLDTLKCGSWVNEVKFSHDGQNVACATDDKKIILWSVNPNSPNSDNLPELLKYSCGLLADYLVTNPNLPKVEACLSNIHNSQMN